MTEPPRTTVIGCLLDVSGSMQGALETGRSDERAVERFRAVLAAALKLARVEHRRDPEAFMFIGVFGLDHEAGCPPVVDLCAVTKALIGGDDDRLNGHELLIALANKENRAYIAKYIRKKLSVEEARVVHAHLRLHPEGVQEFVKAIPTEKEHEENKRNGITVGRCVGAAVVGGLTILTGGSGLLVVGACAAGGAAAGGVVGNEAVDAAEDNAVEKSEALDLARRICKEWLLEFADLVPLPVAEVVNLLQRLQEHPATGGGDERGDADNLLETLRRYMYGNTPMRYALKQVLATFSRRIPAEQRVLILISDGISTDGDPVPVARELQQANVLIATLYLTSDREGPYRQLYDRTAKGWNGGQDTLFRMAAKFSCAIHPIPVLASIGWGVPSSGECALYATVCSTVALEEFCSLLVSARFGSADALLDIVGRVNLDTYINSAQMETRSNPSNQEGNETCYAHATAVVLYMALHRIVGRDEGYPSFDEIQKAIENIYPARPGGHSTVEVLNAAINWYRPLQFREVDEEGARMAVLRRRPVLTTFHLGHRGWASFGKHFTSKATCKSTLMLSHMAPDGPRSLPDDGGHAVVLVGCSPHSLTFLNSWGKDWADNGSFSIGDHTVLEQDGVAPVRFYDVFWLEANLTTAERQAYNIKVDKELRTHAEKHPSILELEAQCPICRELAPMADFGGNIRQAVCPRCNKAFIPEADHLVKALYVRAGLGDVI